MKIRFCDAFDGGFGWVVDDETMRRSSHVLVEEGRAWVIDPVDGDGVEERIREAGTPAGVLQLLDRHNRDSRSLADRLAVPLHVLPVETMGPFEFVRVLDARKWKEVALWWPHRRLLVVAEAVGSAPPFVAPGERLGVHPLLRLTPPRRQLGDFQPDIVLCGHGEGVLADAAEPLHAALRTARRRIPKVLAGLVRSRGR
jgi:hypothetical protein